MEKFKQHYESIKREAEGKLREFQDIRDAEHEKLMEELAFCVFAANSSAKMGLLAVELLRPVLHNGELEDYRQAVHKRVRFYNKRAE